MTDKPCPVCGGKGRPCLFCPRSKKDGASPQAKPRVGGCPFCDAPPDADCGGFRCACIRDDRAYFDHGLPDAPCPHPPGSDGRIRSLTERASRRKLLRHPLDESVPAGLAVGRPMGHQKPKRAKRKRLPD